MSGVITLLMGSSLPLTQLPLLSLLFSFPLKSLRTSFIFSTFSTGSTFFSLILVSLLGAALSSFKSPKSTSWPILTGITRFYFYYQLFYLKVTRLSSLADSMVSGFLSVCSLELKETLLNFARHSSTASREIDVCVLILDSEFLRLLFDCSEILLKCMEVLWLCSLSSPFSRSTSSWRVFFSSSCFLRMVEISASTWLIKMATFFLQSRYSSLQFAASSSVGIDYLLVVVLMDVKFNTKIILLHQQAQIHQSHSNQTLLYWLYGMN